MLAASSRLTTGEARRRRILGETPTLKDLRQLADGNDYLFAYYEYVGDDYADDMARLAVEPRNIEWLSLCDPCQLPLPGEQTWAVMAEIYHNE